MYPIKINPDDRGTYFSYFRSHETSRKHKSWQSSDGPYYNTEVKILSRGYKGLDDNISGLVVIVKQPMSTSFG